MGRRRRRYLQAGRVRADKTSQTKRWFIRSRSTDTRAKVTVALTFCWGLSDFPELPKVKRASLPHELLFLFYRVCADMGQAC